MRKLRRITLNPVGLYRNMDFTMAYCAGATEDDSQEIAHSFTDEEIKDCINLIRERLTTGCNPDKMNKNYKNFIEDLLEEKEALLKKYEAKGAHALKVKALKSEIRRCKRVLSGKPYDRNYKG